MKNKLDEKGYALLIVLLTITIIFSVSSMLISGSISSAKQINFTDEFTRSVDLAEMGSTIAKASFYKAADDITTNTNFITNDMYEEKDIDGDGSREKVVNTSKFLAKVQTELDYSILKVQSSDLNSDGLADSGDRYSLTASSTVDDANLKITYVIQSDGLAGNTNHLINFNIVVRATPPSEGESSWGIFDDSGDFDNGGYLIDADSDSAYTGSFGPGSNLTGSGSIEIGGSPYYQNNLSIDSNLTDITFTGNLGIKGGTVEFGNAPSSSRDSILFNGSFYSDNGAKFTNSDIIMNGYSMTKGLTIDSSKLTVNNNLFVKEGALEIKNSYFNAENKTTVEILGSLFSGANTKVSENSELIIRGNAILSDNIEVSSSGKIIIYGKMSGNTNHKNNNPTKYKLITSEDQADFGKINYFDRVISSGGGDSSSSSDMQFDIDQKDVIYN